MRIYPQNFDSMLIFKNSSDAKKSRAYSWGFSEVPHLRNPPIAYTVFSPPIFFCNAEKAMYNCFEVPYLHFSVILNEAVVVICYCLWYCIVNTCWCDNSYHNTEETIGKMLTNGQKDGHC